ncbi:MAG: hypothetical protein ACUVUC_13855, partial [Thermoguttaceae bacterium]
MAERSRVEVLAGPKRHQVEADPTTAAQTLPHRVPAAARTRASSPVAFRPNLEQPEHPLAWAGPKRHQVEA